MDESIMVLIDNSMIDVDCFDFIQVVEKNGGKLKDVMTTAFSIENQPVIFTSTNAVLAVSNYYNDEKFSVFCIGKATKKAVEKFLTGASIPAFANDAASLALEITKQIPAIEKTTFFCGDKRLDTLPHLLSEQGITVDEIEVYETIETPKTISKIYNAILFFSPSCVNSFFSANKIPCETVLFAIGNTTAKAIKEKTNNLVMISNEPSKKRVLENAINYFENKAIEKQKII